MSRPPNGKLRGRMPAWVYEFAATETRRLRAFRERCGRDQHPHAYAEGYDWAVCHDGPADDESGRAFLRGVADYRDSITHPWSLPPLERRGAHDARPRAYHGGVQWASENGEHLDDERYLRAFLRGMADYHRERRGEFDDASAELELDPIIPR